MLAGVLAVAAALCAPAGRPIVAEVYYDAVGDDTGHEFVELYNPGAVTWSLAGVKLEAGDGAGPARWATRWTGSAADSIAPGSRFVIGGALVTPPPQAVVELGLQNGPDAVRLVWPDGAAEVVGYGALAYPEYFCGAPALDVASGQSLARLPDDAANGSNALDFAPATPSPGRANRPRRDLALVRGALVLDPEQPPAGSATLAGVVFNRGADPVAANTAALACSAATAALAAGVIDRDLAPGDSTRWSLALAALPPGKLRLVARITAPGDDAPENDADTLLARVGPGPLEITEIQFHPAAGEGEWVEVRARGEPADPAAFTLGDRGDGRGVPAGGAGAIAPESLAIYAQDRAALLLRYPALDATRVWQVTPWAALNNSDDSTGIADAVIVRDADGTRSDRVDYSSAGVPTGVPIERSAGGAWGPSGDPAGTPLAPPRPRAPAAAHVVFAMAPRRLRAGEPLELTWSLPWDEARVAIEIFDLAGRRVATPLAETGGPGAGHRLWPAGSLAPGVYRLAFRAAPRGREEWQVETRALRVEGLAR
jgi:hypothetical protein